jgi:hypothetical protein
MRRVCSLRRPQGDPVRAEAAFNLPPTRLKIFHWSAGVELKIPLSQSIILIVSNEF